MAGTMLPVAGLELAAASRCLVCMVQSVWAYKGAGTLQAFNFCVRGAGILCRDTSSSQADISTQACQQSFSTHGSATAYEPC